MSVLFSASLSAPLLVAAARPPSRPGEASDSGLTPLELGKRATAALPGKQVSLHNIVSIDICKERSKLEVAALHALCSEPEVIRIFNDSDPAGSASRAEPTVEHHIKLKDDAHTARLHVSPTKFSPREYELTDEVLCLD